MTIRDVLRQTGAGTRGLKYRLQNASGLGTVRALAGRYRSNHRSGCPVSVSLEVFGDRWSLLIVRDLMIRGFRTFKDFQQSGEGIATNILADRLRKLEKAAIITGEPDETDRRRICYWLTEKGIDLAPVLLELLLWGARHEETEASCDVMTEMGKNRARILAEVHRRWRERDATPLQVEGRWIFAVKKRGVERGSGM